MDVHENGFFFYQSNKGWNEVWLSEYFDSECIEHLDDERHLIYL